MRSSVPTPPHSDCHDTIVYIALAQWRLDAPKTFTNRVPGPVDFDLLVACTLSQMFAWDYSMVQCSRIFSSPSTALENILNFWPGDAKSCLEQRVLWYSVLYKMTRKLSRSTLLGTLAFSQCSCCGLFGPEGLGCMAIIQLPHHATLPCSEFALTLTFAIFTEGTSTLDYWGSLQVVQTLPVNFVLVCLILVLKLGVPSIRDCEGLFGGTGDESRALRFVWVA